MAAPISTTNGLKCTNICSQFLQIENKTKNNSDIIAIHQLSNANEYAEIYWDTQFYQSILIKSILASGHIWIQAHANVATNSFATNWFWVQKCQKNGDQCGKEHANNQLSLISPLPVHAERSNTRKNCCNINHINQLGGRKKNMNNFMIYSDAARSSASSRFPISIPQVCALIIGYYVTVSLNLGARKFNKFSLFYYKKQWSCFYNY